MAISITQALKLILGLISFAVFFQTLEMIAIRSSYSEQGVWRWSLLKREFKNYPHYLGWMRFIFDLLLNYRVFLGLLVLRLICSGGLLLGLISKNILNEPALIGMVFVLVLTTLLIAIRYRGSFNGGSDSMTLLVLGAVLIALIAKNSETIQKGCITYLALQLVFSYFTAGLIKLRQKNWRNGRTLQALLNSSFYEIAIAIKGKLISPKILSVLAWMTIGFECLFPLVFAGPSICLALMFIAVIFHLMNVYVLGLNRFFFAWISAYPALYFLVFSQSN